MARQRDRVFRTNLNIEECREKLRRESRASLLLPDLRGLKFACGFKRDRFWLQMVAYDRRTAIIQPVLYGVLAQDDYSYGTIAKVHFGASSLGRIGMIFAPFLVAGALAALYYVIRVGRWIDAAIIVSVVAFNVQYALRSKSTVRRQKAVLMRRLEELLGAKRVHHCEP